MIQFSKNGMVGTLEKKQVEVSCKRKTRSKMILEAEGNHHVGP